MQGAMPVQHRELSWNKCHTKAHELTNEGCQCIPWEGHRRGVWGGSIVQHH
jgi:hypothetical protein